MPFIDIASTGLLPSCPTATQTARRNARRRDWLLGALALATPGAFAGTPGSAGAWPTKALRLVVGYPSGSSPDMQARLLAEPLSRALGQPVVVDNKPGASGNIGADQIAKADDGHTFGVIGNGPLTSSRHLYSHLPYDPVRDLAPLALIGTAPLVLVSAEPSARQGAAAFLAEARKSGDRWAYGSIGPGSGGHLGMELVKSRLGFQALHVPFNGGPAIINALMGGQVQMSLLPASTVTPLLQSGRLWAVAVSTAGRSSLAPGLPGMAELGAAGLDIEVWNAVAAPARMDEAHRTRLTQALGVILQNGGLRDKLQAQGWRPEAGTPASLAERIQRESALYGELIARAKIRLD